MNLFRTLFSICSRVLPILSIALTACQQEEIVPAPNFTVSDVPTAVNVRLSLPEMNVKTRSDLTEQQLNRVESVWIRTYNSTSGNATSEWVKIDTPTQDSEPTTHPVRLETKSGYSYIVAVANVDNIGVSRRADGTLVEGTLSELLEAADTWDAFMAISVNTPNTQDLLYSPDLPLPMAGCYTSVLPAVQHTVDWETADFTPTFIPASESDYTLQDGVIHLRRLVSQIRFNLIPGPGVILAPQSYSVCNAPNFTWLYERPASDSYRQNAGDYATEQTQSTYYAAPILFTNQFFASDEQTGRYTFDFWQGENKHRALPDANCDSYDKREREQKTAIDPEPDQHPIHTNSGLYTSLTGTTWTANNLASYVIVRCNVTQIDPIRDDDDGQPVTSGGSEVYRSGNAAYVIHLGYCEGNNNADKSADFNCRRNTRYTYNVTVNGIDDIRVDAYGENERYPGEEGLVSDVENAIITLDSHYSAFNIQLTETELQNFGFIVQAWENGRMYHFEDGDAVPSGQEKYIDWIELRPTTGENILAEYKPRTGTNASDATFTLRDAAAGLTENQRSSSEWYTVFVNEYTYETELDERTKVNETPKWMGYVNQDDRRFYVRVTRSISPDGESIYARSKYAVTQRSIQSYYSTTEITPAEGEIGRGTAIGIEHTNESQGLNLRRSYTAANDESNGRYNVWQWIESRNGHLADGWSKLLDPTRPQEIPAVEDRQQFSQDAQTVANHNPVKLPKIKKYDGNYNGGVNVGNAQNEYDPQPNTDPDGNYDVYIEAINACMNRNRDNNGDGKIDADELRWYIPAVGKYLRIILGRASLKTPIMDYFATNNQRLTYTGNGNNSRLLYYSSEGKVLWAMEGLSTSQWAEYDAGNNPRAPWQVRCIRNLGTDLRTATKGEKVQMAYEHDKANRIIRMSYYDINSIRTNPLNGNGEGTDQMPVHTIADQKYNKVYRGFQYSEGTKTGQYPDTGLKYDGTVEDHYSSEQIKTFIHSNPCKGLDGNGWRIPNQKELSIMRNEKLQTEIGGTNYIISCTTGFYNTDGKGSNDVDDGIHNFLMATYRAITQNNGDFSSKTFYYRCVRDLYYVDGQ